MSTPLVPIIVVAEPAPAPTPPVANDSLVAGPPAGITPPLPQRARTVASLPDVERPELLARGMQIIDLAFGALYTLIGFEFVLEMMAARDGNAFKRFLDATSAPFLGPFRTLLPVVSIGTSQTIFSYLVALVVYTMMHIGIRKIARMFAEPPTPV